MTDLYNHVSADSKRGVPLTGAALAQWCYNFPNLAARTIEGLRHADAQPVAWSTPIQSGRQLTSQKDVADRWLENGHRVDPLYLASQPSPAATVSMKSGPPPLSSLPSGESGPPVMATVGGPDTFVRYVSL